MRFQNRLLIGAASALALATTTMATLGPAATTWAAESERDNLAQAAGAPASLHLQLTPSSPALAKCMPNADVDVTVTLATDKKGFDIFDIRARQIKTQRASGR